jgi:acetyltransferase-like isoleucine patch superfamily enzyme
VLPLIFLSVCGEHKDTMTGLGTSLPPRIEIGEQALVGAGAVVRDS